MKERGTERKREGENGSGSGICFFGVCRNVSAKERRVEGQREGCDGEV